MTDNEQPRQSATEILSGGRAVHCGGGPGELTKYSCCGCGVAIYVNAEGVKTIAEGGKPYCFTCGLEATKGPVED